MENPELSGISTNGCHYLEVLIRGTGDYEIQLPKKLVREKMIPEANKSLVEILNMNLPPTAYHIKTMSSRVEKRLQSRCRTLQQQIKTARKSKKPLTTILEGSFTFKVLVDELEISSGSKSPEVPQVQPSSSTNSLLTILDFDRLEQQVSHLSFLLKHYSGLDVEDVSNLVNSSRKKIHEYSVKQNKLKLEEIGEKIVKCSWFLSTHGLLLDNVTVVDKNQFQHKIVFEAGKNVSNITSKKNEDDSKSRILKTIHILDSFSVSDACYHELRTILASEDMPSLNSLKSVRSKMNEDILNSFQRTPTDPASENNSFGCQAVDVKNVVTEAIHKTAQLEEISIRQLSESEVFLKIQGDGTQLNKKGNWTIMSIAVFTSSQTSVLSPSLHYPIAIVECRESYSQLSSSLRNIFDQLNALIAEKAIDIDGIRVPLIVVFGADMKFLLCVMGMKGAISRFSCLYCIQGKDARPDTESPFEYYNEPPLSRSLLSITKDLTHKHHSCENQPLLNVEPTQIVLDPLHLMLRITDKLFHNLISQAFRIMTANKLGKKEQMNKIVKFFKIAGVNVNAWLTKDGHGCVISFSTLSGKDRLQLLEKGPEYFTTLIPEQDAEKIKDLWEGFRKLNSLITSRELKKEDQSVLFTESRAWLEKYKEIGSTLIEYKEESITPYMHAMVYHLPRSLQLYGGLWKFSGQAVEKLNDVLKRIYFRHSNKWDATKEALLVWTRVSRLSHFQRTARKYTKRKLEYWSQDIKDQRQKRISGLLGN